jgi:uncharacterized MnhB-related membrane protein
MNVEYKYWKNVLTIWVCCQIALFLFELIFKGLLQAVKSTGQIGLVFVILYVVLKQIFHPIFEKMEKKDGTN